MTLRFLHIHSSGTEKLAADAVEMDMNVSTTTNHFKGFLDKSCLKD